MKNKLIMFVGTMLFLMNILLYFLSYTNIYNLNFFFTKFVFTAFIFIIVSVIYIFNIVSKCKILEDIKFNIMCFISNFIVTIIILRDLFDSRIPFNLSSKFSIYGIDNTPQSLFMDTNLPFIIALYLCIITYEVMIFKIKRTRKKKFKFIFPK